MSIANITGMSIIPIGHAGRQNSAVMPGLSTVALDAALEALICVGQVWWEDGGSHTISTAGSSSIGIRMGSQTFANAGTSVKVGIAAVDAASGPPVRAVNVADTITLDVSKTLTGGGGGITASSWNEFVPDAGSKTMAHGDLVAVCVQMVTRGGTDTISPTSSSQSPVSDRPLSVDFTGGTYNVSSSRGPSIVLTASDGTIGYLYGSTILNSITTTTWNSGSATKEYGNLITLPFPARVIGFYTNMTISADLDLVLYSDPLGTPVAERTLSIDSNQISSAASGHYQTFLLPSPYDMTAGQVVAAIAKPGASNVAMQYISLNAAAHQSAYTPGSGSYAVNRASGAFAAQNSQKDRYAIGLLVQGFEVGGGGGGLASPMHGMAVT